jgi:hypothetical protein
MVPLFEFEEASASCVPRRNVLLSLRVVSGMPAGEGMLLRAALCAGFGRNARARLHAHAKRRLRADTRVRSSPQARGRVPRELAKRIRQLRARLHQSLNVAHDTSAVRDFGPNESREMCLKCRREFAHVAGIHLGPHVDLGLSALRGQIRVRFAAGLAMAVCARPAHGDVTLGIRLAF